MSSQFDEEWKTRALAALSEIAPALLAEEARLQKIISDYGRTSQGGEVRAVMRQLRSFFDLDAFVDAPALDGVLRSPSPPPPPPSPAAEEAAVATPTTTAAASLPMPAIHCSRASPPLTFPALPAPPAVPLPPAAPSPQEKSTIATAAAAAADDDNDDDQPAPTRRRAQAPAKRKAVAVEEANASDGPSAPKRQQRRQVVVMDAPLKKPITEAIRQQATLPNSTTILSNRNKESKTVQWRFMCDVKNCNVHRSTPGDFHAHMRNKHDRKNGFSIRRACPPAELYWIAEDEAGKVYSGEIFQLDKAKK